MLWFMMKLRSTAMRGNVRIVFPPESRLQGFRSNSSLALAIAARASATLLLNFSSSSFRDLAGGGGVGEVPEGAISRESLSSVRAVQVGSVARWVASQPIVPDFWWGFQPGLSS